MARRLDRVSGGRTRWIGISVATLTIVLATVLAIILIGKPAGAANSLSIEAESMEGAGKVFSDKRASADKALVFKKNRSASKEFTGSVSSLAVSARGDRCKGAPRMVVKVDGKTVMSRLVKAKKNWASYKTSVNIPAGEHRITTAFTNDRKKRKCDRNLRVDKVTFYLKSDGGSTPPEPLKPNCEGSLQSLVDAASSGSVVETPGGCIYRETVVINKPLTLKGGPGVEIRGSDIWKDWTKSGSYWVKGKVPDFPAHGNCETGTNRCLWPEQVFFDGKPLEQVASNPKSGQFAVDANRRVLLADNPSGHTVEVTTRRYWVLGEADTVTIQGFRMKHAANDSQTGAIMNRRYPNEDGYPGWTVQNNVLSDAHGAVVSLARGTGLKLIGNDISGGGQLGVHSSNANLLVQGNKIHHNHTEKFNQAWEAGGMKTAAMKSLTAEGNEVYANRGPGLWCDVSCVNVTYSNNRIHHNFEMGILFEISSGAEIYGNKLWENGWGKSEWGWGAGIVSSSSKNVEIRYNTLAWNADGISVISQNREGTTHDAVKDVYVHHNAVLKQDMKDSHNNYSVAWLQDWDGVLHNSASNNRGAYNRYWYPSSEDRNSRFAWAGGKSRLSEFNVTPGENSGRYMDDPEKNKVISSNGVPSSPESH